FLLYLHSRRSHQAVRQIWTDGHFGQFFRKAATEGNNRKFLKTASDASTCPAEPARETPRVVYEDAARCAQSSGLDRLRSQRQNPQRRTTLDRTSILHENAVTARPNFTRHHPRPAS